jgi:hypothetical protein
MEVIQSVVNRSLEISYMSNKISFLSIFLLVAENEYRWTDEASERVRRRDGAVGGCCVFSVAGIYVCEETILTVYILVSFSPSMQAHTKKKDISH